MPKIDLAALPRTNRTGYPAPFDAEVAGRFYHRLGPLTGLTHMTASHVTLHPGAWSAQRHWHNDEDEMVIMLSGEAVLIDDAGEHVMRPGDIASFPAGDTNGHHLVNRSEADCVFVAIGAGPAKEGGGYSDIDMIFGGDRGYYHRDGTPYPAERV